MPFERLWPDELDLHAPTPPSGCSTFVPMSSVLKRPRLSLRQGRRFAMLRDLGIGLFMAIFFATARLSDAIRRCRTGSV